MVLVRLEEDAWSGVQILMAGNIFAPRRINHLTRTATAAKAKTPLSLARCDHPDCFPRIQGEEESDASDADPYAEGNPSRGKRKGRHGEDEEGGGERSDNEEEARGGEEKTEVRNEEKEPGTRVDDDDVPQDGEVCV